MIRLRDLLEYDNREKEEQPNRDDRSTWAVSHAGRRGRFGAKNSRGDIRYFDDEATARKFASGEIEGPNPGRPEPKQPPEKIQAKKSYDL
jgi:hypothetical protein